MVNYSKERVFFRNFEVK